MSDNKHSGKTEGLVIQDAAQKSNTWIVKKKASKEGLELQIQLQNKIYSEDLSEVTAVKIAGTNRTPSKDRKHMAVVRSLL